jgi:hypothetical protein
MNVQQQDYAHGSARIRWDSFLSRVEMAHIGREQIETKTN